MKKPSIYLLFITVVLCLSVMLLPVPGKPVPTILITQGNSKRGQHNSTDGWDLSAPDIDIIKLNTRKSVRQ